MIPAFVCIIMFVTGVLCGLMDERARWQRKMIEKGLARYNEQTGKWEWRKF